LQDQFSMPRDEDAVDLRRVHRLHRRIDDPQDEPLDPRAIDVRLLESPRGPAVVTGRRRTVFIARRILASGIEVAVVAVAPEVVGPAARRKGEGDHAALRVVGPAGRLPLFLLTWTYPDELHDVALANEAIDAEPGAQVALGIAQKDSEGPIRPFPRQEIEGEHVLEGHDLPAPPIRTLRFEMDRRCILAAERAWRIPMAKKGASGLQPASKRPLAVRQLE